MVSGNTPKDRLEREIERVREDQSDLVDPEDADRILQMNRAYNPDDITVDCPDEQSENTINSRIQYITKTRKIALHLPLVDTAAGEFNHHMQSLFEGELERVKDTGLSKNTVRQYQIALRQFLYVFPDAKADPENIALFSPNDTKVDPSDMLSRDEIQRVRNAADNPRDLAVFDFFLYTGQRNTAFRTLRIKDLDLSEGRFKLNEEADGLKGADENGKWRDLLLSAASIRQWLNTGHPCPNDPDAYVFTGRPKYGKENPHEPLAPNVPGRICQKLKEEAGIDKPMHPHALRHNFVTIAFRRGMSESAIKHQIGHDPGSQVMETTYAHLSDSDHIRDAREAFDLEIDEPESELTPEVCPKCGENPPSDAKLCPWCGLEFMPDAKELMEESEDETRDSYREADSMEQIEKVQVLDDILEEADNDPELKAAIIEQLKE